MYHELFDRFGSFPIFDSHEPILFPDLFRWLDLKVPLFPFRGEQFAHLTCRCLVWGPCCTLQVPTSFGCCRLKGALCGGSVKWPAREEKQFPYHVFAERFGSYFEGFRSFSRLKDVVGWILLWIVVVSVQAYFLFIKTSTLPYLFPNMLPEPSRYSHWPFLSKILLSSDDSRLFGQSFLAFSSFGLSHWFWCQVLFEVFDFLLFGYRNRVQGRSCGSLSLDLAAWFAHFPLLRNQLLTIFYPRTLSGLFSDFRVNFLRFLSNSHPYLSDFTIILFRSQTLYSVPKRF